MNRLKSILRNLRLLLTREITDQIGEVDVYFRPGVMPRGDLIGPSADLMAHKVQFGTQRVARWFGREWEPVPSDG